LLLLTVGLFMKVILADGMLADAADKVFGAPDMVASLDAWAGLFAFSGQIFFDFAGYSTCAVGAALCLGFILPQNFNAPYAAIGFSDFWRRWHITLSAWLRDYLYIPLGGNRYGPVRTYFALMVTMLLGGLWHGANWTFVVWGGLHGLYLWVERFFRERRGGAVADTGSSWLGVAYALFTYMLVNIAWVFFRSGTFNKAWHFGFGVGRYDPAVGVGARQRELVYLFSVLREEFAGINYSGFNCLPKRYTTVATGA
jgi:alginate O-acetyltransferase complex protein AlgI